jgi:8-oxo-dGTP pyrophosphatase MutT (NUDIX family)
MASAVLFRDERDRALLVEPTYKDYWEMPGGAVNADESPYVAAVREVKEELAISAKLGRLLVVDWVPPRAGRTEGVSFVYDGGLLDQSGVSAICLAAGELRRWAWCTTAEASRRLSGLLTRRLTASLRALDLGVTFYLENGAHVV